MTDPVARVTIPPDASIREALRTIDASGLGIALVIDGDRRLLGTVTDGDVRRAILAGTELDASVSAVMKRDPVTGTQSVDLDEARSLFLKTGLKQLPIVDDDGRVLDLLTVSELLSVPLSNPDITDREINAVLEVLRTPTLSLGPKLIEFEARVAEFAQREHAVAVNSGTSGLHLVVRALGLSEGDEVITTPFSFIASANCLLYERVTPVFVDIDPKTFNIDPQLIEKAITPRTRAILAVEVFGQPVDYDAIVDIATRHDVALITDCCESIGAEFRDRRSSRYGDAGVFAFYPNKQITTGEGGVIFTDDADIAALCRSMRNQGRGEGGGWLAHERLGYNYRLSEVSCAMGIAQLDRIDEILGSRQAVADVYTELLSDVEDLEVPYVDPATTRMSWFVYVVRLAERFTRDDRDSVLRELRRRGIGASNYFPPIHLQPFYRSQFGFAEGDFPVTERTSSLTIALPFHNRLSETDCEVVVAHLRSALQDP
jgi:perosamine synthetase